ncbi:MAG: ABC transporter substrate-binding protein [Proteobacteria bacterium]|nr:ABC transporter substrate-binding protein [Pseudomonadota bacterium]
MNMKKRTLLKYLSSAASLQAIGLSASGARAQSRQSATLRLDWTPSGYHAPYFLALSRGFYKEQGIDIQIFDGKGSLSTLTAISEGSDTIGIASLATVALGISQGRPLLAIGGMIQTMPDSVISLKGSGITKPKDLEGKTWGYNPDDYSTRLFPAFAAAAGFDASKVKKIQLSHAIVHTSLLQGKIDFMIGWEFTDALRVARQKPIERPIKYADYGVNMLGGGLFVSKKTAAENPALLRSFMAATAKGFKEGLKDPQAAVAALAAARPSSDRELLLEQLNRTPPYLHTKNSAGKGFGYMAQADWEQTLVLMKQAFETFKGDLKPNDVYTDDFLPKT